MNQAILSATSAAPAEPLRLAALGTWEMVAIGAVILLVFGARKLPELARAMGTSLTEFKKGLKGDDALGDGSSGRKSGSGDDTSESRDKDRS